MTARRTVGINHYFSEILQRVGTFYDDIEVLIHLSKFAQQPLPKAPWIRQFQDLPYRPGRLFRYVSQAQARVYRPQLFQSTYYTRPYWSGLKSVATIYDMMQEKGMILMGDESALIAQKRQCIEQAEVIIAISEQTKQDIVDLIPTAESKIEVIYPDIDEYLQQNPPTAYDLTHWRTRNGINMPYWLYVGRRANYKNFATVLRAFTRLAAHHDGDLVLLGGEPQFTSWEVDWIIQHMKSMILIF